MPGYSSAMRAVWLDVPEEFLAERRRLGHDRGDEVWDGVLHMVPPPTSIHSRRGTDLVIALSPIAKRRGLEVWGDQAGVFRAGARKLDYRIPDAAISRPSHVKRRGLEGAVLVVEVLSSNDESRDKLPFYAKIGAREVWLVEPATLATEIYELIGERYVRVPFVGGIARSPALGIELALTAGALELRDGAEVSSVTRASRASRTAGSAARRTGRRRRRR
jgi:Uma2 family endonuclease